MTAFLRLIRFPNLLIMMCTLCLTYYCLNDYLMPEDLLTRRFISLVVATVLTGAAGYIINDYYDVKLDLVNKPARVVVGSLITRRWAMALHLGLNGFAILLAFTISVKVAAAVAGCAGLLWLYSVSLKKQFLAGNVVVAIMSASVILIIWLYDRHTPPDIVLLYAAFAFGISLLREIIKDAEDMKGDSRFDCKTVPIVLGILKTRKILISLTAAFMLFIMLAVFMIVGSMDFRHGFTGLVYYMYMILCVIIPLGFMIYLTMVADTRNDFTRLSGLAKLIMLSGMLSMILLRF